MSERDRDRDRRSHFGGSYKPVKRARTNYPEPNRDRDRSNERYESRFGREDIIQDYDEQYNSDYGDQGTIDYGSGGYEPEFDDGYGTGSESGYERPDTQEQQRYAHERWSRTRYGAGGGGGAPVRAQSTPRSRPKGAQWQADEWSEYGYERGKRARSRRTRPYEY